MLVLVQERLGRDVLRRTRGAASFLACLVVCCGLGSSFAHADTLILKNGDRISGTIQQHRKTRIRIKTPYGRLNVPPGDVERILREDGTQVDALGDPIAPPKAKLELVITGQAFWQAWRRGAVPADPSLRLELRLDGERAAVWWDRRIEEGELEGAVVNVFDFDPTEIVSTAVEGVETRPLEPEPGRVGVEMTLGESLLDRRVVSLVYQVNQGTPEAPSWRDVTGGSTEIELDPDKPLRLVVDQDGGRMEYAGFPRKSMKRSETFRVAVHPASSDAAP